MTLVDNISKSEQHFRYVVCLLVYLYALGLFFLMCEFQTLGCVGSLLPISILDCPFVKASVPWVESRCFFYSVMPCLLTCVLWCLRSWSLQVYVQPGSYSVDTVAEKSNSPSQSQLAWTAQERTYIVHALLVQMIPVTPQIWCTCIRHIY